MLTRRGLPMMLVAACLLLKLLPDPILWRDVSSHLFETFPSIMVVAFLLLRLSQDPSFSSADFLFVHLPLSGEGGSSGWLKLSSFSSVERFFIPLPLKKEGGSSGWMELPTRLKECLGWAVVASVGRLWLPKHLIERLIR
mmetsp:Transcript_53367/g.108879  ORF Transcript_53367/g.108879 Transcript_53367/m.108879 type:complete len:140 (-) Transcript_53367:320-739(-)